MTSPACNVIGDFGAATGLSEAARRLVSALPAAGVDVSVVDIELHPFRGENRRSPVIAELPTGRHAPIDLITFNINETPFLGDDLFDRYAVATWYWELPTLTEAVRDQVARVDEIWAPARFVADVLRAYTDCPITVIPAVAEAAPCAPLDRERLGISADSAMVLCTFDANSSDARKNPWGAIEAFARAVKRGARATFVLKVNHLHAHPALDEVLRGAVADVGGILLDDELAADDMAALVASADIYVSLHRGEGFGLGLAEAMAAGVPVVATAFGGNTEFMDHRTAALVGYRIRAITDDDHRYAPAMADTYPPGCFWAEPDVDQAAAWLHHLVSDPAARRRLGERGRDQVLQRCSRAAVGAAARDRLAAITSSLGIDR